jgi:hypothetical protein
MATVASAAPKTPAQVMQECLSDHGIQDYEFCCIWAGGTYSKEVHKNPGGGSVTIARCDLPSAATSTQVTVGADAWAVLGANANLQPPPTNPLNDATTTLIASGGQTIQAPTG